MQDSITSQAVKAVLADVSRGREIGHLPDKIVTWLKSVSDQETNYTSFALYCEMLLQQSAILTEGIETPHGIRTAVALHVLQRATKELFGRYEPMLNIIVQ